MADLVGLVSYPKSGNTWMRVLVANYLQDGPEPVDINRLEGLIASSREWFDEYVGLEASALDPDTVECLRAGALRLLVRDSPRRVYLKVHDAWTRDRRGEPVFPADVVAGAVYVLRNPLDLAMSMAHHRGVDLDEALASLCDPGFCLEGSRDCLHQQLRQRLLDWSGHVASWVDDSGLPVHLVRYEDLLAAPEAAFGAVVRFLGLPFDPDRLARAVRASRFDRLQAQERQRGFRERSPRAPGGFFRKGRAGGWREELTDRQVQAILAAHGATMARFGYLDPAGRPVRYD